MGDGIRNPGYVRGVQIKTGRQTFVAADTTADKTILAVPASKKFLRVKFLMVTLNGASVATTANYFQIKDGAATLRLEIPVPVAATTRVDVIPLPMDSPLRLSQDNALIGNMVAALTAGELRVYAIGYEDND